MRLVDADALRREIGKLWETEPDGIELCKEIMKAVNHAPTLGAVPVVHGRWEEQTVNSNEEENYICDWQSARCSVCKQYLTTPYMYYFEHYDYCPNCGAKMSAKEDGEC